MVNCLSNAEMERKRIKMEITEIRRDDKIVLSVSGRVDSTNSSQLQHAILLAFQKMNQIELDFKDLAYLSSAGLRALMIGQKTANANGKTMILRNVNEMVMEVFDITGFADILTIEK